MGLGLEALSINDEQRVSLAKAREEVIKNTQYVPNDGVITSSNIVKSLADRLVASGLAEKNSSKARTAARDILIALGDAIRFKAHIDKDQLSYSQRGFGTAERLYKSVIDIRSRFKDLLAVQEEKPIPHSGADLFKNKGQIKKQVEGFINKVLEIINPKKNDFSVQTVSPEQVLPAKVKLHLADASVHELTLQNQANSDSNTFEFEENLKEDLPSYKPTHPIRKRQRDEPIHEIYNHFVEAVEFAA